MKTYLTDRLYEDSDKALGYSRYEGPEIQAESLEDAKSQAESYKCEVVGILIE